MPVDYDSFCKEIFQIDKSIRFAGVANSKGILISGGLRDNVDELLNEDDLKMSIHYALQKNALYTPLAYKIGNEISSITEFDKVSLITIPINSNDLCLVSTEPDANYKEIVSVLRSKINSQSGN
jgi:hypothetical protein